MAWWLRVSGGVELCVIDAADGAAEWVAWVVEIARGRGARDAPRL